MASTRSKRAAAKRSQTETSRPKYYWKMEQNGPAQKSVHHAEPSESKTDPAIVFMYVFFAVVMIMIFGFMYYLVG